MNISKRALSLVAVAASIGFLNMPAAHGTVSVVSYWRLGEHDPSAVPGLVATNTLDSVGGNTITFTGSPTYSSNVSASAAMDVGSTVCIGFTNGYYGSCPTVSSAVDNFGIEMWVNSANTSGNQCLAYNGNTSSSGWGLYQFGGNYGGLIGGKVIFGSGAITQGVWTHLALVRNNGTMTFYVNGVASGTATATPGEPTSGFALAAPPTSPTKEMFTGLLDEVRVFTFAAGQFNTNDLLLSFIPPPPAIITTNWHFANTGPMAVSRRLAPALLLTNGQVLTAGGEGNGTDAEIYDLRSGSWTNTAPTSIDRIGTTGILLENGRILLAGGYSLSAGFVSGCEIYDPVTATWSTNTGSLNSVRFYHSAVLLTNGNVLVAGGENSSFVPTASAEVYNPTTGTWTNTDSMANAREHHGMTLLPDGRVLVAGGDGEDIGIRMTAEIYNPVTGHWTNTPPLNVARDYVTTTLLTNGQVLVTGGGAASGEVYDPVANTWTLTGPMSVGRLGNTATLLPNGQVLVTGGLQDSADSYASTEVYNPGTGTWTNGASMNIGRRYHAATLLPNGQVLISGGDLGLSLTAAAELYVAPESAPPLVAGRRLNGGTFQISFTNAPSALFNVLATPYLFHPMTNWTVLGNAIEGPAGHFQWSDAPATNGMNRFYKIRNQ